MANRLKIGLIGCGSHMYEFLYGSLRWTPAANTIAACDIDEGKLFRFRNFYHIPAGYTDYREMFSEEALDAVLIAVHETLHFEMIQAALQAGVHVFVEKTPCMTTAEAEELAALERDTGKTVMVGFNRRFMTAYTMAKEIAGREEFGGVRVYQSQFHANPYHSDARYRINHIIHHLDLARFLLGDIRLTHADRVYLDDKRVGYTISFRSEQGAIGTIQSASLLDELYPMERLELIGGSGRNIVVDNVKQLVYNRPIKEKKEAYRPFILSDDSDSLVWNPSHGHYPRYSHHGYENELHYWADCLLNGRKPQPDIADAANSLRLLDELEAFVPTGRQA